MVVHKQASRCADRLMVNSLQKAAGQVRTVRQMDRNGVGNKSLSSDTAAAVAAVFDM